MQWECFHHTASVTNFCSSSTTGFISSDLCDTKSYTNSLGVFQVCHHQITFKGTDHLSFLLAGKGQIFFPTDFEIECLNFRHIEEPTLWIHSLIITATFQRLFWVLAATLSGLYLQDSRLRVLCVTQVLPYSIFFFFFPRKYLNVNQNASKQQK